MKVNIDLTQFNRKMQGLISYSEGFIQTLEAGTPQIAKAVADEATEDAYDFIDALARSNPERLHHVYEWGQVGDSLGRLFTIEQEPMGRGRVRLMGKFLESMSEVPNAPGHVFHNKAAVMEAGQPVTINPSPILAWEGPDGPVFTTNPVTIVPGGDTAGQFEDAFRQFETYLRGSTQFNSAVIARLRTIGTVFKQQLRSNPTKSGGVAAARKVLNEY